MFLKFFRVKFIQLRIQWKQVFLIKLVRPPRLGLKFGNNNWFIARDQFSQRELNSEKLRRNRISKKTKILVPNLPIHRAPENIRPFRRAYPDRKLSGVRNYNWVIGVYFFNRSDLFVQKFFSEKRARVAERKRSEEHTSELQS